LFGRVLLALISMMNHYLSFLWRVRVISTVSVLLEDMIAIKKIGQDVATVWIA
jgi:hypothetical protein